MEKAAHDDPENVSAERDKREKRQGIYGSGEGNPKKLGRDTLTEPTR